MAHGFVYVLSNESMPGIYKIGFTLKHPKERMGELSRATACPTPFELMAFIGCEDPASVEREIHESLGEYRVNAAREFFKAPPDWIQDLLREYGDPCGDAFFGYPLDWEVDMYHFRTHRQWLKDYFFSQCADPIEWKKGFD